MYQVEEFWQHWGGFLGGAIFIVLVVYVVWQVRVYRKTRRMQRLAEKLKIARLQLIKLTAERLRAKD